MMKRNFLWLLVPLLLLLSVNMPAQACPSSATLSTSSVANACAGNGQITTTFTPNGASGNITVQLLKSGSVLQNVVNPTSPYTFTNLQPGTDYEVRLICSTDNSQILETAQIAVADKYQPISDADISAVPGCTNFLPGGTITINGVMGGTAPYLYKVVQSDAPTFPDTEGTYSSNTVYNVPAFGNYQIRIKDACGNYRTFTKKLSPSVNPVQLFWKANKICGDPTHAQGTFWYLLDGKTGGAADTNLYTQIGVKLKITDPNTGEILFEGVVKDADGDGVPDPFVYKMSSSHIYNVELTTACGETSSYKHWLDNTNNPSEISYVNAASSTSGCGTSEKMNITLDFNNQYFWKYPVTITLRNKTTNAVSTYTVTSPQSYTISGLDVADYDVTVKDSCNDGASFTTTATNPKLDGAPAVEKIYNALWNCDLGQNINTGTTQIFLYLKGYIADRPNAVVTITAGPSNVGVKGIYIDNSYWGWSNMIPGGHYTISITSCGTTEYVSFDVDKWGGLVQSIDSLDATSVCQGGGNIIAKYSFNGSADLVVQLTNTTTGEVFENKTGVFNNLPAGTYSARLKIVFCGGNPYYIDYPSSVTLTGEKTGPVITSSVGVVCEDGNGQPLTTGTAYLDLSGAAPYTLQYKPSGSSTWTTINDAPSKLVISDLAANVVYDLQLTDGCGYSYTSSVVIKTMQTLHTSNTVHPCNDQPYTLSMPYYAGATYQWIDPNGTVISDTRTYNIANYDPSYNGTYTAKITWGNCVTRYETLSISSTLCGQPIGNACYKDAGTSAPVLQSKHGITALGRAGVNNSNWPMVRKGAHTVLEAKTKGFVINRLTTSQKNTLIPAIGMMVYDVDLDCLSIYDGTAWKCYKKQGCPDF